MSGKQEKHINRKIKIRKGSFGRQVSLETGFSVLNGGKTERKALPRSGKSFSGFGSAQRTGAADVERGDFSIFRTKSGLVRQNSKLPLRRESGLNAKSNDVSEEGPEESVNTSVPAGRYFAALKRPDLDQVKDFESILLPTYKKWPFLLRFPIGCFGICLGLSSQAILWQALANSPVTKFLHVPSFINLIIWLVALSMLVAVFLTYALKCMFYFETVKREYYHPVRVNFFFTPWIVCMFLAIGVPTRIASDTLHPAIWCIFMAPIIFLDLKIYGQWLSGGKRHLCKVANVEVSICVESAADSTCQIEEDIIVIPMGPTCFTSIEVHFSDHTETLCVCSKHDHGLQHRRTLLTKRTSLLQLIHTTLVAFGNWTTVVPVHGQLWD